MNNLKLVVTLFLAVFFLYNCNDEPFKNDSIYRPSEAILNVSYGEDKQQIYDIYLPENRNTSTKVLILIHGGGWVSGDKEDMIPFKNYIKIQFPEYAIVNINYRLASKDNPPFPMQLNDISKLITHLKNNKDTYLISDDIGFIGVSAGGHLALLWSYQKDIDHQTKMVCSIVGPTNLDDEAYKNSENPEVQYYIDKLEPTTTSTFLQNVSPLYQATDQSPATILFYGGKDPLIPYNQGPDLKNKLDKLNVTNQLTVYPKEGHGWVDENLQDTILKLKSFISTHF